MIVNLMTDAPQHNLALMKLSSYYKANGCQVMLNQPLMKHDISIGSWLFRQEYPTDLAGGPAVDPAQRLGWADGVKPDYDLFSDRPLSRLYLGVLSKEVRVLRCAENEFGQNAP